MTMKEAKAFRARMRARRLKIRASLPQVAKFVPMDQATLYKWEAGIVAVLPEYKRNVWTRAIEAAEAAAKAGP
jgi:hypothetical protein